MAYICITKADNMNVTTYIAENLESVKSEIRSIINHNNKQATVEEVISLANTMQVMFDAEMKKWNNDADFAISDVLTEAAIKVDYDKTDWTAIEEANIAARKRLIDQNLR